MKPIKSTLAAALVIGLMFLGSKSAFADKLCLKIQSRPKGAKITTSLSQTVVSNASTCPRGFTELQLSSVATATVGATGATGAIGPTGATGDPGPFPATLPSGKTLTGAWNLSGPGSIINHGSTIISFPYPLATKPTVIILRIGQPNSNCPGDSSFPGAMPGFLCIFEGYSSNIAAGAVGYQTFPADGADGNFPGFASRTGAALVGYDASLATFDAWGTWAVTAP